MQWNSWKLIIPKLWTTFTTDQHAGSWLHLPSLQLWAEQATLSSTKIEQKFLQLRQCPIIL